MTSLSNSSELYPRKKINAQSDSQINVQENKHNKVEMGSSLQKKEVLQSREGQNSLETTDWLEEELGRSCSGTPTENSKQFPQQRVCKFTNSFG